MFSSDRLASFDFTPTYFKCTRCRPYTYTLQKIPLILLTALTFKIKLNTHNMCTVYVPYQRQVPKNEFVCAEREYLLE